MHSHQGRNGLGNIYVWASGDGGEEDDCNCDGYAASMWTISINSAINDGQNAHYDESCSSTLASTFSNGAKDPNTGVVSRCCRDQEEDYSKELFFWGEGGDFIRRDELFYLKCFIYCTDDKMYSREIRRNFTATPLLLCRIIFKKMKIFFILFFVYFFTGYHRSVWKMHNNSQRDVRRGTGSRRSIRACS